MANRYPGKCNSCGESVKAGEGHIERAGRRWIVWCQDCFDRSDNASAEDRECGNRAYEDRCAEACGFDPY
jgi:hypothetical protein